MIKIKTYALNCLLLLAETIWLSYHIAQSIITFVFDKIHTCLITALIASIGMIAVSDNQKLISHRFIIFSAISLIPVWIEFYITNSKTSDSNMRGIITSLVLAVVVVSRDKLIQKLK